MNQSDIFIYAQRRCLLKSTFQDAGFTREIEKISTIYELLEWLGTTPFPQYSLFNAVSILEMLNILSSFNVNDLAVLFKYSSRTGSNVITPSEPSIQDVKAALARGNSVEARYLTGRCLSLEVMRWRPNLRVEVGNWIACRILVSQ